MKCRCQQDALYRAERQVANKGREFRNEQELQEYVDLLRESPWWERNFSQVLRVESHFKPSGNCSVGGWEEDHGAGVIEMLPVHRNELYVLHEICHVLAAARFGSQSHDPWFARIYLEAVYSFMGPDAYAALREAFQRGQIDHDTDNTNPAGRVV